METNENKKYAFQWKGYNRKDLNLFLETINYKDKYIVFNLSGVNHPWNEISSDLEAKYNVLELGSTFINLIPRPCYQKKKHCLQDQWILWDGSFHFLDEDEIKNRLESDKIEVIPESVSTYGTYLIME